ncbi:MAG: phosphatidate cytidylyltransferase [Oligoflexia bacterium]
MKPELKKRIVTGVVGGAVLLGVTLGLGYYGTAFFAVALALLLTHEYLEMVLSLPDRNQKRRVIMGIVWLLGFFSTFLPGLGFELILLSFVGVFFYFLFTAFRHQAVEDLLERHLREAAYCFFGILYLGFLPLYLPLIRDQESGVLWLLLFFLMNWAVDSAAYFVGLKYGRKKLYPGISPKKTWEGAWGGLGAAYLVTLGMKLLALGSMSWAFVLLAPAIVGFTAQAGDLCESFIKRAFHKKDSSHILPGHGGFMDRFDGLVVSAPFMYLCIQLLG